jgi:AP-1 complex subunit gamma-1
VEQKYRKTFRKLVGTMIKTHKSLLSSGYTPDYDIAGITDPFLQVYLLHALRLLGEGSTEASEEMYDLLTQLASNPDTGKSTSNAILYECARTIVAVEASPALKVLGINILGKFLANKDSNTRYIALNLLKKVVRLDYDAVQRHKATILDCLKENDQSIRKCALDLLSQLVNKTNIKSIVKELFNILVVADIEFQADLAATVFLHYYYG